MKQIKLTEINQYYDYEKRINSVEWRLLKYDLIMDRGNKCEECGKNLNRNFLELHHKTYNNLGGEHKKDLLLVCSECHSLLHKKNRNDILKHSIGNVATV